MYEEIVEREGAFPYFLRAWWFCSSPVAVLFAVRIMWEKTVWTWSRGPQMVGFSLMHVHPLFAIAGMLCCLALMIWLLLAVPFAVARRKAVVFADAAMIVGAIFVAVSVITPDNFFAG